MAKVLVVEDDDDIRALIKHRVGMAGHVVLAVPDGGTALRLVAERGAPEIAVLDVGLPDIEGPDLLVQLRDQIQDPKFPAVFLSARVNQADVERGRRLDAPYLTKPLDLTALLAAIASKVPASARGWN